MPPVLLIFLPQVQNPTKREEKDDVWQEGEQYIIANDRANTVADEFEDLLLHRVLWKKEPGTSKNAWLLVTGRSDRDFLDLQELVADTFDFSFSGPLFLFGQLQRIGHFAQISDYRFQVLLDLVNVLDN